MQVKGGECKDIQKFIKEKFGEQKYKKWLESLPEESKKIFSGIILESLNYDVKHGSHIPLNKMCEMFYSSDKEKGAREYGKWSGKRALTTTYKNFLKSDLTKFVENIPAIYKTYHKDSDIAVSTKLENNKIIVTVTKFEEPDYLKEISIVGYFEAALELMGKKVNSAKLTRSLAKGDKCTEFILEI
jgi:hypothetical protein